MFAWIKGLIKKKPKPLATGGLVPPTSAIFGEPPWGVGQRPPKAPPAMNYPPMPKVPMLRAHNEPWPEPPPRAGQVPPKPAPPPRPTAYDRHDTATPSLDNSNDLTNAVVLNSMLSSHSYSPSSDSCSSSSWDSSSSDSSSCDSGSSSSD